MSGERQGLDSSVSAAMNRIGPGRAGPGRGHGQANNFDWESQGQKQDLIAMDGLSRSIRRGLERAQEAAMNGGGGQRHNNPTICAPVAWALRAAQSGLAWRNEPAKGLVAVAGPA